MEADDQAAGVLRPGRREEGSRSPAVELQSIEEELKRLRSRIEDLGHEIDLHRSKIAGAMGGGVFLILLAGVAAYDLIAAKDVVWLTLGITRNTLYWIVGLFAAASFALFTLATLHERRRSYDREELLVKLEQEMADLDDRRETILEGGE